MSPPYRNADLDPVAKNLVNKKKTDPHPGAGKLIKIDK
jgi:hypothetical protein